MTIRRVIVLVMFVGMFASTAHAGIFATGDVTPADPATWLTSTDARIGDTGSAGVTVDNGSDLVSGKSYLGYHSGSTGAVTVSGAGSTWTSSSDLYVGHAGAGELNIANGASVSDFFGYIGFSSGSTGAATVSGAGSTWTNSSDLCVGYEGEGSLDIADGGLVEVSGDTYAARRAGSAGAVNFDNGTLTTGGFQGAASDLSGAGTINTNGLVSDVDLVFGASGGLTQTLSLNGPGQNITVNLDVDGSRSMGAGYGGAGSMHISDGLTVQSTYGYLGRQFGSTGAATVSGAGSAWSNSIDLYVGQAGDGELYITNSGAVSNSCGYIAREFGSTGSVTVSGPGATWSNSIDLHVGHAGGGELNINNSAVVSNRYGYIGRSSGSTGAVTVSGAGSTLTNSRDLYVGQAGDGELNVTNGAVVHNRYGYIGREFGSAGSVTVSGEGSTWSNSGILSIGDSGDGTLEIINGAVVSNGDGYIGYESGSTGAATVSGAGSTWTNSSDLTIGRYGAGVLTIDDGGLVEVSGAAYTARYSGAAGAMNFGNGTLTTGGFQGSAGDLSGAGAINTNWLVSDVDLIFGAAGGLTQTLTFNGPGQNITVNLDVNGSGPMCAGYGGVGSMHISDGLTVPSTYGYIGYHPGSTGAATVSGAGSTWSNSIDLHVGRSGAGELDITHGSLVSNRYGYIGRESGSTGSVTVSGAGAAWSNSIDLYVGRSGAGELNITNGAAVSSRYGYIGRYSDAAGAVTVSGAGSTWSNSGDLYVGYAGVGALDITDGAAVSNGFAKISYESGATGAVTVCGAGSAWTNSGDLYVGYYGDGALDITKGAAVSDLTGYIGFSGDGESVVTVNGAGSTWTNSSGLFAGYYGRGVLNIHDGGLVRVAGGLTIDDNGDGDSFISMGGGGMLALYGDADDSLGDFLGLIGGTDAIRCWDESVWGWVDLTVATPGEDYILNYLTGGDLDGYTVLTVPHPAPASMGDTNYDYIIDGSDYDNLVAQFGGAPGDESADFNGDGRVDLEDFAILRRYFGSGVVGSAPDAQFVAVTPEPAMLILMSAGFPFLLRRRRLRLSASLSHEQKPR